MLNKIVKLTRLRPAASLADGPEFLRAKGSRHARSRTTDASQGSPLKSFPATGVGDARFPRRRFPGVERLTVGQTTRLQVGRPLSDVTSGGHRFGIDPFVSIGPVAGDAPVLDSVAARVRTVGPLLRLPGVRAGGLVAAASRARRLSRRRLAKVFVDALLCASFDAVHLAKLVALAAALVALSVP